ncbi:MAG: hypothetical protein HY012_08690 [Acidobacteria bacterium]|nr:hypothetical protein [Acidobacteriota bacterium]
MKAKTGLVLFVVMLAVLIGPAASAQQVSKDSSETNTRAYIELMRKDVRAEKARLLGEVMNFTTEEAAAFWPIYREYELEVKKLNDERLANIEEYARNYLNLTDEKADELIQKALSIQERKRAEMKKCYERVRKVVSGVTAARFLQVEHQLDLLVDLQIAASLPIVE